MVCAFAAIVKFYLNAIIFFGLLYGFLTGGICGLNVRQSIVIVRRGGDEDNVAFT